MRLIDADALRATLGITGAKETCKGRQYNNRFNFACNTDDAPSFAYVCEAIDDAPTIDAEPVRHGKWIDEGQYADYHPHHAWRCSECGEHVIEIDTSWFKYCPNCGARMDEE